jgi:ParB family chromosome partitioning protein
MAKDFSAQLKKSVNEERARTMARFAIEDNSNEVIMGDIQKVSTVETFSNQQYNETKLISVDLGLLSSNPYNARVFYNDSRIESLAESISREGQIVPIVITDNPNKKGSYLIIDGEFRFRALKLSGASTAKCDYHSGVSGFDLYHLSNLLNKDRTQQTVFDDAAAWQLILDRGAVSDQAELCVYLDKDKATVSKVLAINSIYQNVARVLSDANIGMSMAYEFAKLCKVVTYEDALEIAIKIVEQGISLRDLAQLIKRYSEPKKEVRRNTMQAKPVMSSEGKKLGSIKFDDNKMTVDLVTMDRSKNEKIAAEVEAVLLRYV